MTLNVIPLFLYFYLLYLLVVVYAVEMIAAAVLSACGGRARQWGTGIAAALVGTAICLFLIPVWMQYV
ncbi:hypothetical protein ACFYTQ_37045 [Nocardia sp. NPDC004068]|uniref:hypothetical protein n=1 Tax=Nocardia sp. NPDC004068 TaxID=3364303 RepID=UPI0036880548